jgi:hypothetical protein
VQFYVSEVRTKKGSYADLSLASAVLLQTKVGIRTGVSLASETPQASRGETPKASDFRGGYTPLLKVLGRDTP